MTSIPPYTTGGAVLDRDDLPPQGDRLARRVHGGDADVDGPRLRTLGEEAGGTGHFELQFKGLQ